MRGSVAKRIRGYVRDTYPFLSSQPLYVKLGNGTVRLAEQCQRRVVQRIKKNYKARRKNNNES